MGPDLVPGAPMDGTARQGQTVGQRGDGQRKAPAQFAGESTAGLALPAVQGPEPGPAGGISGLGIQHTDHTALRHIQGPTHAGLLLQTTGQQGQITFAAPPPGFGLAKIPHRGVQAVRIIRHGGTDDARRPGIQALQQGPGRRDGALGPQRRDGDLKAAAAAPGQTDAVPACGFEKSLPAPLTGKRTWSFSTGSRIRKNFRESRGKADTVALTDTVGGGGLTAVDPHPPFFQQAPTTAQAGHRLAQGLQHHGQGSIQPLAGKGGISHMRVLVQGVHQASSSGITAVPASGARSRARSSSTSSSRATEARSGS